MDGDRDNPGSVAGGAERDEGGNIHHRIVGMKESRSTGVGLRHRLNSKESWEVVGGPFWGELGRYRVVPSTADTVPGGGLDRGIDGEEGRWIHLYFEVLDNKYT